ncbi:class I SAM-dependent methyltransferase [Actinomycetospora straminea]|uniref:Methyltransferase domain-containing protein n=1 Tax=Actinomycetospora straminea TaxID=663607 RepID=A0ABP9E8A6_9PSEU|nr:methyltransferase domain-containing protein [Actinomycetospora straminea]MDD7936007.1 methyltransferase domain-containing protein [Actinomycetospora straminea]
MTARERLAPLLDVPLPADVGAPYLDLVDGRPGSRGRIQDLWESGGGAGFYDLVLAGGDRVRGRVPGLVGGAVVRDFYDVARRLDLVGGETVLDLACGPGTLTRHLADAVGADGLVVGADLSPPMLRRAARAVRAANTVFVRADAMALPLRDGAVEAVCCSLCLQLVPDLDTALAQIRRVLAPGGRFTATVPTHGRGPLRLYTELLARGGQARLFHPGELADALVRHGFVRVATRWGTLIEIVDAVVPGAAPPRG